MRDFLAVAVLLCMSIGPAWAQTKPSAEVLKDLAPTGKLRAAINLGNGVLAQKDEATGKPKGITPDLAFALGKRLGVEVELVVFTAAGKVFEASRNNAWDIAFIAIEPVRAAEIEFTAPYAIIDGTYMVRDGSPLKTAADADRDGIRIAVGQGSAYDLFLSRTLKHAKLFRSAGGGTAAPAMFDRDKLDAAAGVRQALDSYAKDHPGFHVMSDKFMEIRQAMGTPKGRLAGAKYLSAFVEDMKASGFVAEALKRSGQQASVAPAAR